jgi:hypothetical protein
MLASINAYRFCPTTLFVFDRRRTEKARGNGHLRIQGRSTRVALGKRHEARYSSHFSSCRSCTGPAPTLVRLGVARLGGRAASPLSANAAHRVASLCHRYRVDSLATVSAHSGGDVAGGTRRHRTSTWTVSGACSRRSCVPRFAGVARRCWRDPCVRGDSVRVPAALFPAWCGWAVVKCHSGLARISSKNPEAPAAPMSSKSRVLQKTKHAAPASNRKRRQVFFTICSNEFLFAWRLFRF